MANELICLDTSVLIDYFRKTNKENSFLFELTKRYSRFAVSAITEFEILIW
jgi:tRNA(fMet)-specific endonuclease VapC